MPSHITHTLFAEEVLNAVTVVVPVPLSQEGRFLCFGAQGPDYFLHNQRTRPSGLVYGRMLHTHDYGAFSAAFLEGLKAKGLSLKSPEGYYLLGFITHAPLDRETHPFINFFSGWTIPGDESSMDYYMCHPYMERLIDSYLLIEKKKTLPKDMDFAPLADLGDRFPETLESLIIDALKAVYPRAQTDEDLVQRIRNAYLDTHIFYDWTGHATKERMDEARKRAREGNLRRRAMGLFHPSDLPEVDFMNISGKPWSQPCDETAVSTESFLELYDKAARKATKMVSSAVEAFEGKISSESMARIIGNSNLSDTREEPCDKKFSRPLPLGKLIDALLD